MTCPDIPSGAAELRKLQAADPMLLSSKQLLELACMLARVGTVICDLGRVGESGFAKNAGEDPEPYIWDIKED